MDKEVAKKAISELVEKYKRLDGEGKLKNYNEEMTKNEFIEPLFEALGWDVRNRKVYDEVIKEHAVLRGRVDYALRLNGVNRLFIEAKPFRADMNNSAWAKQVIEYGYNKGVSFVILTNFEVLRVFNSEWNEPNIYRCTVLDLKYTDYIDKFDELSCLSREATEQNLLVEKANAQGKRNPRKSVQELLSEQLILWRERLAKNIKSNYGEKYDQDTVDEIAQKFIDRLIFIRTCEERNLEGRKLLESMNLFASSNRRLWPLVKEVYAYYRQEYDSNLFGKDGNDLHELEKIDFNDNVVHEIISSTYKKDDFDVSYNFGDIDADVLGSAYEQYLGHLLKTTAKRAKTEDSHAHRKEQGIYYTPRYIVDYIVRNTIGEMIKDMKPEEVEKLRILDPACGSGSFLIRAFDEIHNHHLLKAKAKQGSLNDDYALQQKMRILKNNIYGVDLDGKAVEIAQLNLMLKAAEKRHRLPLLQENIKNGNSLIDDPSVAGAHAFKWEEKFASIMKDGGFDVVVGNPPWISFGLRGVQTLDQKEDEFYRIKYSSAEYKLSIYALFIEIGIRNLKQGGYLSFILPDSFLLGRYFSKLRRYIMDTCSIRKVVFTEFDVFAGSATTGRNVIIILQKKDKNTKKDGAIKVKRCKSPNDFNAVRESDFSYNQEYFEKVPYNRFRLFFNEIDFRIIKKMDSSEHVLSNFLEPYSGCIGRYGQDSIMSDHKKDRITILDKNEKIVYDDNHAKEKWKPLLPSSSCVRRYRLDKHDAQFIYIEQDPIKRRIYAKSGFDLDRYRSEKLFMPQTGDSLTAAYASEELYCINNVHVLTPTKDSAVNIKYLMALINSKLYNYYYHTISLEFHRTMAQTDIETVEKLPVRETDAKTQTSVIEQVEKMISLSKKLAEVGDQQTNARRDLEEEIKKTDAQIDDLVYKIYGITDEEKKIIEKSFEKQ